MKRSAAIQLTLLAATAAALTGCSRKTEIKRCIDDQQRIVDDRNCEQGAGTYRNGMYIPYRWWYGGSAGTRMGDTVFGGSSSATPGFHAVTAGEAVRGGFGSHLGGGS